MTSSRLPPLSSSRQSLVSTSSQASVTSRRSDVTLTGEGDDEFWVGAPEAISSVRRPRKSIGEQQASARHQWRRSKSVKEKPARLNASCCSLSRSQSLRNGTSQIGRLIRTGSGISEASISPSASEQTLQLSVECLTLDAEMAALLNQKPTPRRLGGRLHQLGKPSRSRKIMFFF